MFEFVAPMIWTRNATDRPRIFRYTCDRYAIEKTARGWTLYLDDTFEVGAFRTLADAKRAGDDDARARREDPSLDDVVTVDEHGQQLEDTEDAPEPADRQAPAAQLEDEPEPATDENGHYVLVDVEPERPRVQLPAGAGQRAEAPAPAADEAATDAAPILIVVPSGAAKLDHPAPARDLYTSDHFRHVLAAAQAEADATARDLEAPARVVILSALHGLLELDDIVDPYDVTMADAGSIDTYELVDQLRAIEPAELVMMLPAAYRFRLETAAHDYETITGHHVVTHDAYEDAAGIGYQRAAASAIRRAADVSLDTTTAESAAEHAAREAFNRDADPAETRRWDELTDTERDQWHAAARQPRPGPLHLSGTSDDPSPRRLIA